MARLQGQPWDASTQTSENSTLDGGGAGGDGKGTSTFPLHRRFYADFTHDSSITAVLAALELPRLNAPLEALPESPDAKRGFVTSQVVPFAARFIVEVLECAPAVGVGEKTRFVRALLNDAVLPLDQLPECARRRDGMCEMSQFIQSQAKRNERAEWSNCTRTDLD